MKQTWRWFGPADKISINEICQTGAQGIVTALHHIPTGDVWPVDEIKRRQHEIAFAHGLPTGIHWDVVESLPVSESIKTQTGAFKEHVIAYKKSLINLADCGIYTVCYNFMPVLDWTRTELARKLDHGGTTMSFNLIDFAGFDCFVLKRSGAEQNYSPDIVERAKERMSTLSDQGKHQLGQNIVAGLPGANDNWTLDAVNDHLATYQGISAERLRSNLIDFMTEVIPTAEDVGIQLCCHPDDPPFSLLGLPRIMSNEADYEKVMSAVTSPACGITFCTGSLGVADSFDPKTFIEKLGARIHFVHLRNTTRENPSDGRRCSFHESEHLAGDTDMVGTIHALLREEQRRRDAGRTDHEIPMRPDHGHALCSDIERDLMPGYPLIGRLRGLAELRGVMAGYGALEQNKRFDH